MLEVRRPHQEQEITHEQIDALIDTYPNRAVLAWVNAMKRMSNESEETVDTERKILKRDISDLEKFKKDEKPDLERLPDDISREIVSNEPLRNHVLRLLRDFLSGDTPQIPSELYKYFPSLSVEKKRNQYLDRKETAEDRYYVALCEKAVERMQQIEDNGDDITEIKRQYEAIDLDPNKSLEEKIRELEKLLNIA